MPWGTYRLTITDPKSGASSSYRFYSGWAASARGRPARPHSGRGRQAVLHARRNRACLDQAHGQTARRWSWWRATAFSPRKLIDAPAGGTSVDIPVSADWGAGAYVLVTDYRPLNDATGREPVRAIGVAWLGVDNSARTLTALIGGPQKILPRQKITIPVTIKGLDRGEDAYLTLAAVDEGILQLTDFKSPDPAHYYFGKRRLGVGMRDDYGRLIKAEKGAVGRVREGGDSFGGRSLAVVPHAHRRAVLRSGESGRGRHGQRPARHSRLQRRAAPDGRGDEREQARPCRPRRSPCAIRWWPTSCCRASWRLATSAGGAQPQQCRRRARHLYRDGHAHPVPSASMQAPRRRARAQISIAASACWCPVVLNGTGLGIAKITLKLTGPGGFPRHACLADRGARAAARHRARERCRLRAAHLHRRQSAHRRSDAARPRMSRSPCRRRMATTTCRAC